ncbi:hypothetical protein ACNPQM_33860 [Streptomyces sp. NPDC056231]|uniref:hypothetical protein n=1 Tax=Streptomyces sp. NPDC056231 TaxID=3345755 RepID=UPI003AAF4092
MRDECLGEGDQAEDAGLALAVGLLHGGGLQRGGLVVAGVVDQGVDPAELLDSEIGEAQICVLTR